MAQTPNVCPALHMPLQSGSDRMLKAMRRSYRAERYLGIIDRVRAAMPHAAITTDIIVGFPGETEEDFQATLDVVRRARFASAFTFQYSKRPGTPAAELPDQLPKEVVQERYERLIALQEEISLDGEPGAGRPHRRTAGRRGRGPQGHRDRADERPGPRRPAGALRARRRRGPARRRGHHRGHRRRAAPPDRRRRACSPTAAPAPATRTRPAGARAPSAWACPAWAQPDAGAGDRRVRAVMSTGPTDEGFDAYRAEIEAAERRVAREIDPGPRAVVVAILVFVLLVSFVLPHTGAARGVDVLMGNQTPRIDVGDRAAVAGVLLAGAGVRGRVLDAGAADPALGAGLGGAGGFVAGQRDRAAGGLVAPDRAGAAIPARASGWSSRGSR